MASPTKVGLEVPSTQQQMSVVGQGIAHSEAIANREESLPVGQAFVASETGEDVKAAPSTQQQLAGNESAELEVTAVSLEESVPTGHGPVATQAGEDVAAVAPIEVDLSDDDSAFGGSDSESRASSLLSSVRNYQFENGRRYHGYREGTYLLPNDEKENDRLDIFHHLMGIVNRGKLHRAPLKSPQRILDIGTGTGIWAMEMGDEYPSAEVLGIDISPIQPSLVPPNVHFQIDDVEEPWTFSRPFDLIHCRYMPACISDFPLLVRQAYKHTKPGGWVEFSDWDLNVHSDDGSLTPDHAFKQLHTLFQQGCGVMGRVGSPGQHLRGWVEAAGFQNIHHIVIKLPFGTWPKDKALKEIGAWNRLQIEQGLEAFAMAPLNRVLKWSVEEVQLFLVDVRKDCANREIHSVYDYHIVYGQKPTEATGEVY